jgi:hypothetical protein
LVSDTTVISFKKKKYELLNTGERNIIFDFDSLNITILLGGPKGRLIISGPASARGSLLESPLVTTQLPATRQRLGSRLPATASGERDWDRGVFQRNYVD